MKHRRIDFATRMALMFIALMLALLIGTSTTIYNYIRSNTNESIRESIEMVTQSNADSIAAAFGRMETSIRLINSDQSGIAVLLNSFDGEMIAGVRDYNKACNQLKSYMEIAMDGITSKYRAYLFVDKSMSLARILVKPYKEGLFNSFTVEQFFVQSDEGITGEDWFVRAKEQNAGSFWFTQEEQPGRIYYVRNLSQIVVENFTTYKQTLGVILVNIGTDWIGDKLDTTRLTDGTEIFLLNESAEVLYSSDTGYSEAELDKVRELYRKERAEDMYTADFRGREQYVQRVTMDNGLTLVTLVPAYDISEMARGVAGIVYVIAVIVIIVGIVFIILFSRRLVRPVRQLSVHMKESESLTLISTDHIPDDEVGGLYRNFNSLMLREKQLLDENMKALRMKEEAELKTLQAQINPHFLYNTLDSVCCMALIKNEDDIAEALSSLAAILRYNIKEPDSMVKLSQELGIIRNYIDIQKLRCGKRLNVEYELEVDADAIMLPKMIIQPLVENSISHGANPEDGSITLIISCIMSDRDVEIRIEDDGRCSDIEQINRHLTGACTISGSTGGFGIRNVKQRIEARFGDSYGLHYEHAEGGGTIAAVRIPYVAALREMSIQKDILQKDDNENVVNGGLNGRQ